MSKPLEIGVTGGIGSGKTLICKIFSHLGAPVYNADARARHLMNNSAEIKKTLLAEFGEQAYTDEGLNRQYLADTVFNNKEKLALLNSIVHPIVGQDYGTWVKKHNTYNYVINEAALMFESGSYKRFHKVINVHAPAELRLHRVLARDPFRTEKELRSIMDNQLSEEELKQRSHITIVNDEKQMVLPQVLELHREFSS